MPLLKIAGLIIVFCASCLFGFYKSIGLKGSADRIYSLIRSFETLAEYIRLGNFEILPLIEKCFPENLVWVSNNKVYVNREILDVETVKRVEEFFAGVGMNDKKAEYERTLFYKTALQKEYDFAFQKYREQGRLYNTLGILCGLFLILFLV